MFLETAAEAFCRPREMPEWLSRNEMTEESCCEPESKGSLGPPTRDGSSPSESANVRPATQTSSVLALEACAAGRLTFRAGVDDSVSQHQPAIVADNVTTVCRHQRASVSVHTCSYLANCSMSDEFSRQSGHIKRTLLRAERRAEAIATSSAL